jgi:fucose 4-O-acetylase-like acetyltransferase
LQEARFLGGSGGFTVNESDGMIRFLAQADGLMSVRSIRIDTLRGSACLLLVAYHLLGISSTSGLRLPDSHPLRMVNEMLAFIRMPLFSFLSGYVYALRPYCGDPAAFIAGKARRLLVPMLIVGTLFALLREVTPGTNFKGYDWSMLHIVPVAHYWFLASLFLIFIVIAALEHFEAMASERRFALVLFAAACLHITEPFPVYFGLQGAAYLLPFVLFGIWCNRFGDKHSMLGQLALGASIAVAAALYAALVAASMPARSSVLALAIGGGACLALLRSGARVDWLAWVGRYSFAIYLFHSIFTAASRIFLRKAGVSSLPLFIGVGMLAGVFLPIVTELALKRVPAVGRVVLGESKRRTDNSDEAARTRPHLLHS